MAQIKGAGQLRERQDKNGATRFQMIIDVTRKGKQLFKSKTFDSKKGHGSNLGNSQVTSEATQLARFATRE